MIFVPSHSRTLGLLLTLLLIVGCGKPDEPSPVAPTEKVYTIGVSQCNMGEPWRVQMNADIQAAAAKHKDLKVIFKDAQNDTRKQRAHVEELVAAGVDLIIVSPREAQPLTEPVAKAHQAKIPVIVLDRAVIGDQYTCFIGADNRKIGRAAGEWLAGKLGGKGKVVELMGLMTSTPAEDRHKGFQDALTRHPEMRVVYQGEMKWLEPEARKEMESALAKCEVIDAVYAHNDPGAHGAYLAAKAAGREKGTLFVGIDALPQEGVKHVKQGLLSATFEYPTGGAEAIDTARKILVGQEVPKKIVLRSRVFTPENVARGGDVLE